MTNYNSCGILENMNKWALFQYSGPGSGRTISLKKNNSIAGRGHEAEIQILDTLASRRHAELTIQPDGVTIKDLGSSNGIFIQGKRLREQLLKIGDSFNIGQSNFYLIKSDEILQPKSSIGLWQIKKITGLNQACWHYTARQKILERDVELEVLRENFIQDNTLLEFYRGVLRRVAAQNDPSILQVLDQCQENGKVIVVRQHIPLKPVKWTEMNLYERGKLLNWFLRILKKWSERGMIVPLCLDHVTQNFDGNLLFRLPSALDLYIIRKRLHIITPKFLPYTSPEEFLGASSSARTETYRLGTLLFEALTGELPRKGCTRKEIETAFQKPLPRPRDFISFIPPQADQLITRLLSKNPKDRPSLIEVSRLWPTIKFPMRKISKFSASKRKGDSASAIFQQKIEPRQAGNIKQKGISPQKAPISPTNYAEKNNPKNRIRQRKTIPRKIQRPSKIKTLVNELIFLSIQAGIFFLSYKIVYFMLKIRS